MMTFQIKTFKIIPKTKISKLINKLLLIMLIMIRLIKLMILNKKVKILMSLYKKKFHNNKKKIIRVKLRRKLKMMRFVSLRNLLNKLKIK